MAKKVNLKNINIDNGELNPVTIGYLNNRKKGPFLMIFVFAILIALLYYMPQVSNYINQYINPSAYQDNSINNNTKAEEKGVIKELKSTTTINVSNKVFSDFILNNTNITFKISDTNSLDNYYLITYDNSKTMLETLPITSNGQVLISKNNVSYIAIDIIENYVDKTEKESDLVSCVKDADKYEYTFEEDKLVSVKYEIEMTKSSLNESSYNENYEKFSTESGSVSPNGITTEISTTNENGVEGFIFIRTINLKEASMVSVNDENAFSYEALKDDVLNVMNDKGYTCN